MATPVRCAPGVSAPAAGTSRPLKTPHPALRESDNPLPSPDSSHPTLLERKVFGVEGGSAFLECEPRSLQARVEWTFQRAGEAARSQVSLLPLCCYKQALVPPPTSRRGPALANEALGRVPPLDQVRPGPVRPAQPGP